VRYCRERNIALQAYSPLGAGKMLSNPVIAALAGKYIRSPAQVCLRWCLQNGFVPLPKSVRPQRIESNFDVFDFALDETDVLRLDGVADDLSLLPDADEADF
jgi:2,5-diketo-D-gluconate reductase A